MGGGKRIVEVCVDSVSSAINARQGGADRLEVCQNLELGGTTPSYGLLQAIIQQVDLPIVVMLRPRAGDFCYSAAEFDVMLRDIAVFKQLPICAIVSGILTPDGALDKARMAQLITSAKPLKVVLHRAFDMTCNLSQALADAADLGIGRILTSGGAQTVKLGLANLKKLLAVQTAVEIMPGGGVDPTIALELAKLGARQIHLSGKRTIDGAMRYRKAIITMSTTEKAADYSYRQTDSAKVAAVVKAFKLS